MWGFFFFFLLFFFVVVFFLFFFCFCRDFFVVFFFCFFWFFVFILIFLFFFFQEIAQKHIIAFQLFQEETDNDIYHRHDENTRQSAFSPSTRYNHKAKADHTNMKTVYQARHKREDIPY